MIEIIQEENWDGAQDKRGLPKNIKQIGTPDAGDRIYIENSAYQKMHPYGQKAEKMAYVMLGRFDDFAGRTCIFIEDVVKMNEIEFRGKLPVWNDDSWGSLYRKLRPEHENMIIVGWAIDICGQAPSMTAQLERIHQTYFGGIHQILFLMDTLEREEVFYGNWSGYLKRRDGFYIYYDKTIPGRMESAIESLREEVQKRENIMPDEEEKAVHREESYRNYLNSRRADRRTVQLPPKRAFSSTWLLLIVILALGYTSIQNHQQMKNMELTLNQIELQAVMQTEVENENAVRVEEVMGNVTPIQVTENTQDIANPQNLVQAQTEASEAIQDTQVQENSTQNSLNSETEALSEADTYLAQGYYIVQAGDSLAGICRKIYRTTAMMEAICKENNIKDPDAIFVGQRLVLPN